MEILDDYEKITCRLCGLRVSRIYGKHLNFKHNNMKTEEYKNQFPGAPIMSPKDLESTNKNSGLHMKEEKYKSIFRNMYMGEKNPNHKSKKVLAESEPGTCGQPVYEVYIFENLCI
jgi:hypothetical protein